MTPAQETQNTVSQCTPIPGLGSILRAAPASPTEKVRAALVLRGLSIADMARSLGLTPAHVGFFLRGERDSEPLRRKIPEFLGVEQSDIWPPVSKVNSLPSSLRERGAGVHERIEGRR